MVDTQLIAAVALDQAAGEYAATTFFTGIQMFLGDVTRYANNHQVEVGLGILGIILLAVFLFKKG